jgi:hypothetical protein
MTPHRNSSTHIHSFGHDAETGTLAIKFHKGGSTYHYPGVPAEVHSRMHSAASAGEFFHTNIRGRFKGKKV